MNKLELLLEVKAPEYTIDTKKPIKQSLEEYIRKYDAYGKHKNTRNYKVAIKNIAEVYNKTFDEVNLMAIDILYGSYDNFINEIIQKAKEKSEVLGDRKFRITVQNFSDNNMIDFRKTYKVVREKLGLKINVKTKRNININPKEDLNEYIYEYLKSSPKYIADKEQSITEITSVIVGLKELLNSKGIDISFPDITKIIIKNKELNIVNLRKEKDKNKPNINYFISSEFDKIKNNLNSKEDIKFNYNNICYNVYVKYGKKYSRSEINKKVRDFFESKGYEIPKNGISKNEVYFINKLKEKIKEKNLPYEISRVKKGNKEEFDRYEIDIKITDTESGKNYYIEWNGLPHLKRILTKPIKGRQNLNSHVMRDNIKLQMAYKEGKPLYRINDRGLSKKEIDKLVDLFLGEDENGKKNLDKIVRVPSKSYVKKNERLWEKLPTEIEKLPEKTPEEKEKLQKKKEFEKRKKEAIKNNQLLLKKRSEIDKGTETLRKLARSTEASK